MSDLQRVADDAADKARRIANALTDTQQRIRDAMAGQPGAQTFDGPGIDAQGVGDPTGEAAVEPDQARKDELDLPRYIRRADAYLQLAVGLVNRYTPRPPSSIERRNVEASNEPGCESCSRIEASKGVPRWEQPYTKEPSTVTGILTEPKLLCDWCYRFVRNYGRLPYLREVRDHHDGKRVYVHDKPGSAA